MKKPNTKSAEREARSSPPTGYAIGDKVEVLDPGLAMLRQFNGGKPNHHGKVAEIWSDGQILVEFRLSGKNHSQVAPYPPEMVRRRA